MKFETPKMNIELFISEDILTTSGDTPTTGNTVDAAQTALNGHTTEANTFRFTL